MWTITWRRFRRSRLALAALVYVGVVALIAAGAPLIAGNSQTLIPFGPNDVDVLNRLHAPDAHHRLGTDELGRDVLARMIHGARVSLTVGLLATAMSVIAGSLLGAIAGYYGGAADWVVSRLIEIVLCFPFLFLVLAIVAFLGPSIWTIMLALTITSWPSEARFVRGEVMRVREMEFAQAARASGARDARIIFRHLLPNALAPVLVSASFGVAYAIVTESALSFLGLGVRIPTATWGSILSSAREYIEYAWWMIVFPGLAIFLTVAAFNIIGDRFRDALDPRSE
ncbi:MAG: peptide/nickel transport system permease protein [Thermoanaerobaculia bacterium]|jgi:peptide/nickel transport system permease protein|nr:peptide/nickel transport system permease protein [Thermoanaerobaculia bacterium]